MLLDSLARWATPTPQLAPPPLRVRRATLPVPPPPQNVRQIVEAPAVAESEPPPDAYLGRNNQRVERQMIAPEVGEAVQAGARDLPGSTAVPPAAVAAKAQPQEVPARTPAPGRALAQWLPDPFATTTPRRELARVQPPAVTPGDDATSSRQANAVAEPYGPVTLLNTKSHPFADYLIERGHRAMRLLTLNAELTTWYRGDLSDLRYPAVVVVTVDANGTLIADGIEQSSGSPKVDRMLLNALRGSVRGIAPPPEAVEAGRVVIVMALDSDVMRIGIR